MGSREVEGLPMKKKSRGDEVMCEWEERGGEGQLNAFSTAKDEFVSVYVCMCVYVCMYVCVWGLVV